LPKGTQLLMQLHLLNATSDDVSSSLAVDMRTVAQTSSEAGIYGFGTTLITLPPNAETTVTNFCTVEEDVDIFAVFPHMHTLGKSLTFEVGPDADHLHEEYRIDPWDFGNQFIAPHPLQLHPGDVTRTSCTFDNTRAEVVEFGESTTDEMCFFTAFRTDYLGLAGCLELGGWAKYTPAADAGAGDAGGGTNDVVDPDACATVSANDQGIGASCTASGNECATGLSCTADVNPSSSSDGICIQVGGCTTSSDCGSGASCCAPAQAGGALTICVPTPCRPVDCAEQP
jgi:hypothetical protein